MDDRITRPLRILVAPDSFKGSLTSAEAGECIAHGIARALPGSEIRCVPVADGGEGTVDSIVAATRGSCASLQVTDANGDDVAANYVEFRTPDGERGAAIDVASIVGLPAARVPPEDRTTRGIGQALRQLAARGVTTVAIGLGGSSTMDGGAGLLAEIAVDFSDRAGKQIRPTYRNLPSIESAGWRSDAVWLQPLRLIALSDVRCPLTGEQGASRVFGEQKGFADLADGDRRLARFADVCERGLGRRARHVEGAGAAGGLGFALALVGAEILPGAEYVLQLAGIEPSLDACDWLVTGEGRSDSQTMLGKTPALLAKLARARGIGVTLISGAIDPCPELDAAFDGCFSIMERPASLDFAMTNARGLLERAAFNAARVFARARLPVSRPSMHAPAFANVAATAE